MLQSIRDRRQGVVVRVFIGFIIAVFALFGIESIVGTLTTESAVVTVNGVEIDEYVLEAETQNKTSELLSSLGGDIDPSVLDPTLMRDAALNDLIQQELLTQAAKNSGMLMPSAFLDRQIAQTADFQINGQFDNERALLLLQSAGYTPSTYKASLAREGVLNQLLLAYSGTGFATDSEIDQLAALTMQKRSFRYLLISLEGQTGIEVEEAAIEEYYQSNLPDFMREEQVSLEYLELSKEDIFDEVEINEEQILTQYDLEVAKYQSEIERRVSHIMLEAFDPDSYDAARTQAEELKTRIDNGESFEELAAEFSNDTGSAVDGGDLGYTNGNSFDEAIESSLLSLSVGEVSDPVRTDFGIHLIKLTEQSALEIETFEDSRDRISRDMQQNQVDDLYSARAEELSNLSFESIDLDDPADIMGLEKQFVELFGRSGGVGIAAQNSVINAAFASDVLNDELNSELIALGNARSVVIRLVDHNLPEVMAFEEVRFEIEILLQTELMREQVQSIGDTVVRSVESGQNIDTLLAAQDLNWNQVNDLERSNTSVNPELIERIFTLSKPLTDEETTIEGFQLENGEFVVVDLQTVTPGSVADLSETELDGLKAYITQQGAANDYTDFLRGMQARADIRR